MGKFVCTACGKAWEEKRPSKDGVFCDECKGKTNALSEDNKIFIKQMESWLIENEAREKQIRATIETSIEIARQNELQLQWQLERTAVAKKEYAEWKKERGLE